MHATIRTRPFLVLLATLAAFALPTLHVRADHVSAPVTGIIDDGGSFDGTFRVNRFRSTRLGVVATGLLIGVVTDAGGDVTDVLSIRLTVPVADMRASADGGGFTGNDCDSLSFDMDPVDVVQRDFTAQLDPFVMTLNGDSIGITLGSQLCTIEDGFTTGRFTQIVSSINNLLNFLDAR